MSDVNDQAPSAPLPLCTDPSHAHCLEERSKYEQGWKRALADYQNLKRDTERQQQEFVRWCTAEMLLEILPVVDHFDEALLHVPIEHAGAWTEGFKHIRRELEEILKRRNVESFGAVGESFTPSIHEAVEHQPITEGSVENTIARVVTKGYRLDGKTLRPAKVIVFTNPQDKQDQ